VINAETHVFQSRFRQIRAIVDVPVVVVGVINIQRKLYAERRKIARHSIQIERSDCANANGWRIPRFEHFGHCHKQHFKQRMNIVTRINYKLNTVRGARRMCQ